MCFLLCIESVADLAFGAIAYWAFGWGLAFGKRLRV